MTMKKMINSVRLKKLETRQSRRQTLGQAVTVLMWKTLSALRRFLSGEE